MIATILGGALLTLAAAQQTDTVFAVRPDARLAVSGLGGEVVVRTWDRNEMRVVADHSSRDRLDVRVSGSVVRVGVKSHGGVPRAVEYNITMPSTMSVEIGGTFMDADVRGVQGRVQIETVQGDIVVEGGGRVSAQSVQGDVDVRGARGTLRVGTTNGELRVREVVGELTAETVNGEIFLEDVDSRSVAATTVNGDVVYLGTIHDGGTYWFNTHNGDIEVSVPQGANVTITVATFNGDFESDFPVTITGTRDKRFSFTIGDGSARLELETFGGSIRLRRPESMRRSR